TGVVYSITAQTGVTYSWTVPTGVTITAGQGTNSITTTSGASAVSGNVSVSVSNSCGSQSGVLAVSISGVPSVPTISGSTTVCRGQASVAYSTTAQSGVTYSWTVPTGVSIVSGQGTNAIVTSWSVSAVSGNVGLTISNSCGSQTGSTSVNVIAGPQTPLVSGSNAVCAGQSAVVYTTTAQSGMTYTWTVPAGVTITSGQGTNSITTTWGASAATGNVSVVVSNICNSLSGSLSVTVNPAFSIGTISGPAQLCPPQTGITYSVSAQTGASYSWTVPSGVTITSGQGTNSIVTSWSTTAVSGNVGVSGSSACGSSSTLLPVSLSGGSIIVQPITGPDLLCRPATGAVYSVLTQTGVTYSWTVPAGVTITSGQGTNSITTSWGSTALSGGVSVLQNSACGSGTASFFVTLRTSIPASPGSITGNAVVCRGDQFVYSIRKVSTADYYVWTPGAGMTINGSTLPFNTPDTAVVVAFTTAFNGDSLRVNTGNCKGVGVTPKALFISRGTAVPATPGFITGQNNALCGPSSFTYNINTTVANAVSYTWRISVAGALINGQPSPVTVPAATPGVTVTFPANFTNTGTLYVKSNSGCGSSAERSLSLKAKPDPATAIFGKDTVCRSTTEPYSVTPRQGVTIWTWTVPNSVSISSGQNTANVNLTFNSTTGSRSIKVTAKNTCGSSTAFTKSVLAIACLRMAEQLEQNGLALDAYPNPANDGLYVSMESEHEGLVSIQLHDLSGRLVYQEQRYIQQGSSLMQLDVSGFVNGMYILSIHGQEIRAAERISISR
ncbi:MAG: T9SS type A sorting domain-containing protein, partial [Sphingobacteriales bacterium]|nr:T9SS type A sorting domain-containing protein [Sphingobacteriales bacterium]